MGPTFLGNVVGGWWNIRNGKAAAAMGALMGPVGPSVAVSSQVAITKQWAKNSAATAAAKTATPPLSQCDPDFCKQFKPAKAITSVITSGF
jgi:hypothetical protein